jgi:hypothetical protein
VNVEPDFGDTPIEDDPTGMRRLLAALPDPGPMPEDLTARILAAIASEAAARPMSAEPVVPAVPRSHQAVVTPITHRSRHRGGSPASLRWLAAAAAVGVIGAGGFGVVRMLAHGLSGSATGGAALSSPAAGQSENPERASDTSSTSPALGPGPAVKVASSGTDYTAAGLADQAAPLLRAEDSVGSVGDRPEIATPERAQACAKALGVGVITELRVDNARFQGEPAAVLLVKGASGWQAYAVPLTCGDGTRVTALAGPVPVG